MGELDGERGRERGAAFPIYDGGYVAGGGDEDVEGADVAVGEDCAFVVIRCR